MQVQADMLFNGERFTLHGKTIYKVTAEPSIEGPAGKEVVTIPCTIGERYTTITVPLGTEVTIQRNPVR